MYPSPAHRCRLGIQVDRDQSLRFADAKAGCGNCCDDQRAEGDTKNPSKDSAHAVAKSGCERHHHTRSRTEHRGSRHKEKERIEFHGRPF